MSAKSAIEALQICYFFDAVESNGVLKFIPRGGKSPQAIDDKYLIESSVSRVQEKDLPKRIDLLYLDKIKGYYEGVESAVRQTTDSHNSTTLPLPVVLSNQMAKIIANIALQNIWSERNIYKLVLAPKYCYLKPGDIISLPKLGVMRVTHTNLQTARCLDITAVSEDIKQYEFYIEADLPSTHSEFKSDPGETIVEILDIDQLPFDASRDGGVYIAVSGSSKDWRGAKIDGINIAGAVIGNMVSESEVSIINGEIQAGQQLALIGNKIVSFEKPELIEEYKYKLDIKANPGDRFILLNANIHKLTLPNSMLNKEVSFEVVALGDELINSKTYKFIYKGNRFKPLAPKNLQIKEQGDKLLISWERNAKPEENWQDFLNPKTGKTGIEYLVTVGNKEHKTSDNYILIDKEEAEISVYQISPLVGRGGHLSSRNLYFL